MYYPSQNGRGHHQLKYQMLCIKRKKAKHSRSLTPRTTSNQFRVHQNRLIQSQSLRFNTWIVKIENRFFLISSNKWKWVPGRSQTSHNVISASKQVCTGFNRSEPKNVHWKCILPASYCTNSAWLQEVIQLSCRRCSGAFTIRTLAHCVSRSPCRTSCWWHCWASTAAAYISSLTPPFPNHSFQHQGRSHHCHCVP